MGLLLGALAAVLVGTVLQRVSGTGVGLVVAPVLSLLMGPGAGVLATNAATTCSGFLITLSVRRLVEWRHAAVLVGAAVPGIVAGAVVVRHVPSAWLQVAVGAVVLAGLGITRFSPATPSASRRATVVPAGLIGGFFNATAGVAAPAMVIYSRVTRWDQVRFAATMQPVFMAMGALSAGSKLAAGVHFSLPVPAPVALAALVLTVLAGIAVGTWLSRHMSKATAQGLAMALATVGGVVVLARGALTLLVG
ncbi:sulfite exporter TauE/SafE family protein [Kocuria rhizophila]|uniref:sulfite exporter TauE/SafE family protein n=1 Tax=Kocuria rhizophila TaxID=72000 RepID=UPI00190AB213|nr:sulfite exporter TauE/SafE family protein [Kocuria rhizophila]MBK4120800.1 sulfite exporter TauE/SafE family protein [Kocuria rhizophila]